MLIFKLCLNTSKATFKSSAVALLIFKLCLNISKGPKNIENLLSNPLSLATWFMDDRGKGGLHRIIISVHSFTNDEIEKLIYSL